MSDNFYPQDINPDTALLASANAYTDAEILALPKPFIPSTVWDASAGTFPSGDLKGYTHKVSVAGTVDGVAFGLNDVLVAEIDAPSTTVFAGNWQKWDVTADQVITLTGDVTGSGTGTFAATLAASGVGAGSYTNANVTVDTKGRVTTITSGSSGSGGTVSTTNEVPSGTVNGSNTAFTLTNSAANNEAVVTINGLKQKETTDYTLSGTALTFVVAPFTGALVEVYYVNSTSAAGFQVSTKTANYSFLTTDYLVIGDTTSTSFTFTLPDPTGMSGHEWVGKKSAYANTLSFVVDGAVGLIDGSATLSIGVGSKGALRFHCDGANYFIV